MSFFHKKKASTKANAANVHMTEAEAALAQSDFNIDKILEIQNKFTGGTALLVPGRIFIREGMLWKICRKGPKKRQFFLFNDILVYGSVVAGRYSNQHVLPLAHMAVSGDPSYQPQVNTTFSIDSLDEQLDVHNAFQISHADKSFHVFSLSQADKANWLANLQKHINKVALVGGSQSIMPRAVWVPDSHSKECMVCGQKFTAFNRKHHCRQCGRVVCSSCSPHRVIIESQVDGKPERVCSGCVKEIPTVKGKDSPALNAKPPPAAVAAQLVSSVLRHNSEHQFPNDRQSPQSPRQHRDSTDTEDSDDSEREEGTPPTRKKPTPVPRRSQSEKTRHTASTGLATSPPQRPPPYISVPRPPASSKHQPPTTKKELPKPKPRPRKPDPEVEVVIGGENGGGGGVGTGGEAGGRVEMGGEGGGGDVVTLLPQPTRPPRKRKKEKQQQQLEQELQKQLLPQPIPQLSVGPSSNETQQTSKAEGEREREGEGEGGGEGEVDREESGEGEGKVEEDKGEDEGEGETGVQVEGLEAVEVVEVEDERVTEVVSAEQGEEEGEEGETSEDGSGEEGEFVTAVTGDREEEGDKGAMETGNAPKRPRRRKKHFTEGQDAGNQDIDSVSDPRLEDTPTDPAHQDAQDSSAATDQEPNSTAQEVVSLLHVTDQSGVAEGEVVGSEESGAGQRPACESQSGESGSLPGQPSSDTTCESQSGESGSLPGQPSSDTMEDDTPIKKPRGRRPKFKSAEN